VNPYTVSPYLREFPIEPAGRRLDPGWRDRAACAGTDPDLFFPEPDEGEDAAAAKVICAGCPVRAECLAWALAAPAQFGVFGGLDERERHGIQLDGPRPCVSGEHLMTPGNTYVSPGGKRRCRACRAASRSLHRTQHQPARKAVAA